MSNLSQDFENIFKSNFSSLCNIANNIIKNENAAEDIVQDVFYKLWQKRNRSDEIISIKAYLIRAVTNASIDHLKSNRNIIVLKPGHEADLSQPGDNRMVEKELEAAIERALRLLPPKCRAIFVLSRYEGMKYKEIAEHLDISVKTVENQMVIALEKMRTELRPHLTKEYIGSSGKSGTSAVGGS